MKPQGKHTCENECYRKAHQTHTYCTSKHLVEIYQVSIKTKGKEVEMNFIDGDGTVELTHIDVSNLF